MARKLALMLVAVAMLVAAPVLATDLQKVDINNASKEELMTLDGIGAGLADRIIEHRNASPFKAPEDLKMVKGIGDKKFEMNKDRIMVGKPPTPPKTSGQGSNKAPSASEKAKKSG